MKSSVSYVGDNSPLKKKDLILVHQQIFSRYGSISQVKARCRLRSASHVPDDDGFTQTWDTVGAGAIVPTLERA